MKNRTQVISIIAIAVILVNVIFFNIPIERTNVFWWSFAFTNIAFIVQFIVWDSLITDTDTKKGKFLYLPMLSVSTIYLIIQLFATWRLLLIPSLPEWVAIIVYSVILGIAIMCMLATSLGTKEVKRIDKKVANKVNYIRLILTDVEILLQKETNSDVKNVLNDLYEQIRYSDPMSNDLVADVESKIRVKISEINNSNDKISLIKEIQSLIMERNIKIKNLKQGE